MNMKKAEFIDSFADLYDFETILRIDGFDEACIGWTNSWSGDERPMRLVYDQSKMIEILMQQGMEEDEALEYFDFNIAGSHMGEYTPLYLET